MNGGPGDDTLDGGAGADTLLGFGGNDTLWGGGSGDSLDGGDGAGDVADYSGDAAAGGGGTVSVDLGAGTATDGFGATDTLTGIEFVRGTDFNDTIVGDATYNLLEGFAGNDSIVGGGSGELDYDTLVGGLGQDTLEVTKFGFARGEEGNDTIQAFISGTPTGDFVIAGYDFAPGGIVANLTAATQNGVAGGTVAGGFFIADGYGTQDTVIDIHYVVGSENNDLFFADASFINQYGNWVEFEGGGGDDLFTFDNVTGTARISYRTTDGPLFADLDAGTATDRFSGTSIGSDSWTGANEFLGSLGDDFILGKLGDDQRIRGNDGDDYIDGRGGDDRIEGEGGNDTLVGGSGEDQLFGGEGDDSIEGGGALSFEFDVLYGGGGNDHLTVTGYGIGIGEAGNDTIRGLVLDDLSQGNFSMAGFYDTATGIVANLTATTRNGVAGGDTTNGFLISDGFGTLDNVMGLNSIAGSSLNDIFFVDSTYMNFYGNGIEIRPGAGDDEVTYFNVGFSRISYRQWDAPVTADMELGIATDRLAGGTFIGNDTFFGVKEFGGSGGDDEILGQLGDDQALYGHNGNDVIMGRSGDDRLYGEDGNDTLDGGSGSDYLRGGQGNDFDGGGAGTGEFDDLRGGDGNDTLYITGLGMAFGGEGNDIIRGFSTGGPNPDDWVQYGYDTDPGGIIANLTAITRMGVAGGNMTDGYSIRDGYGTTDNVLGGHVIIGSGHDDVIFVDDTHLNSYGIYSEIRAGAGDDQISFFGSLFPARVSYRRDDTPVYVDMELGFATDRYAGVNLIGMDTFTGANEFRGSDAADHILGNLGDDRRLQAEEGDDLIDGRSGNDFIQGEGGNDLIFGGEGNDTIEGGSENDRLKGEAGNDEMHGGSGNDFFSGRDGLDIMFGDGGEDLMFGGTDNDYLEGGTENDSVYGGTGEDTVFGNEGNDLLVGQDGDDTMYGGSGADNIVGGGGADSMIGGTENDTLAGQAGNDTIEGGDGNDQITGKFGDDSIDGGDGADNIFAGAENDTVNGGIGNDTIRGETQEDVLNGDGGDDLITGGAGRDTLNGGSDNDDLFGQGGLDIINGDAGNDDLYGGDGNDVLSGGSGNDRLFGGNNNDRLDGGSGTDELRGNAGVDTFVFALGYEDDSIISFQVGTDRIELNSDILATSGLTTVAEVLDTANGIASQTNATTVTLDFGGGDVLVVGAGSAFVIADLSSGMSIV